METDRKRVLGDHGRPSFKNKIVSAFTTHHWKILVILGAVNFVGGLIDTIQAPTYNPNLRARAHTHGHAHAREHPHHSHDIENDTIYIDADYDPFLPFFVERDEPNHITKKRENASDTSFGLFVGGFDITQLIMSPVIGATIHILGVRTAFMVGVLTGASSTTVFGLLKKIGNPVLQHVSSFVARIVTAAGSSAMMVAMYSLLTTEFPRTVAIAFGVIQTLNGFGRAVGPVIGSIMFMIAGNTIPFLLLGLTHYVLAFCSYSILPKSRTENVNLKPNPTECTDEEKGRVSVDERAVLTSGSSPAPQTADPGRFQKSYRAALSGEKSSANKQTNKQTSMFSRLRLKPVAEKSEFGYKKLESFVPYLPASEVFGVVGQIKSFFGARVNGDPDLDPNRSKRGICGYISLLRIPAIQVYTFGLIVAAFTSGFVTSILQPHLLEFNMSSSPVGKLFLLYGSASSVFAILWGVTVGRVKRPERVLLFGAVLLFLSILPIGPIPYILSTQPNLEWSTGSLILIGLGMGAINIAGFVLCLDEAKKHDFPEDGTTSGLISSIFVTSLAFGGFAGPTVATFLYHHIGFRNSTIIIFLLCLILIFILSTFISSGRSIDRDPDHKTDEETPLLSGMNRKVTDKYYYHVVK